MSRAGEIDGLLALFDLVGVLARRRYQIAERYFAALGLNHTEARLLSLLQQEGGSASQDALSGMLNVDRSNAGRGLKRLEQAGLVERREGDADKRTNLVHMTATGRKTAAELSKLRKAMARDVFGDLSQDGARKIVEILKQVPAELPDR